MLYSSLRQHSFVESGMGFAFVGPVMASRRRPPPPPPVQPQHDRLHQVRRMRRRGEDRKALLILREECFRASSDARLWAMYAAQCWRMGRREDTCQALRQAIWYRERAHDVGRVRVLRALLSAAETGHHTALRAA